MVQDLDLERPPSKGRPALGLVVLAALAVLLGAATVVLGRWALRTRATLERSLGTARGDLEKANAGRARLERRKDRELSRQLALASKLYLLAEEEDKPVQPQRAALLAIEALRRDPNRESREAVRAVVSTLLRPVNALEQPEGLIRRRLSPSGRYTVSISETNQPADTDGSLRVIETLTGKELVRFPVQWKDGGIEEIHFSPNEQILLVKDRDRAWGQNPESLWIFDWHRHQQSQKTQVPAPRRILLNESMQLRFSADNRSIVALLRATVRIYDAETGVVRRELPLPDPPSWHERFRTSPTSPLLFAYATQSDSGEVVKLAELNSGSFTQVSGFPRGPGGHHDPIWLEFSLNGRFLLIANREFLAIWGVTAGRATPQPLFVTRNRWFTACALSPDGEWVAAADYFDITHVWNVKTGEEVAAHRMRSTELLFSRDGNWLIGSTEAEGAAVWSFRANRVFARASDGAETRDVKLSEDGRYLYTQAQNASIRSWDMPSHLGVGAREFPRSDRLVQISGLKSSTDSSVMAVDLSYGGIVVWETATNRTLYASPPGSYSMDLSADGKTLAVVDGKALSLIELATSKVFQRIPLTSSHIDYRSPDPPDRRARVFWMEPGDAVPRLFDSAEFTEEVPSGEGLDTETPRAPKDLPRIQRKVRILPTASFKTSRRMSGGSDQDLPAYRDSATGRDWPFASMGGHIHRVKLSRDGSRVAVSTLDYLFVFDAKSGRRLARIALGYALERPIVPKSWAGRAGSLAEADTQDGRIRRTAFVGDFWFQESDQELLVSTASEGGNPLWRWVLRPDGTAEGSPLPIHTPQSMVAMASGLIARAQDGQIQILRLDGTLQRTIPAKGSPFKLSDEGRLLVVHTAGKEGDALAIWNLQTGTLISTIGQLPSVNDAILSADGEFLLITGMDTETRLYRISDATEQARIPQTDRFWDVLALDAHARFVISRRSDDKFITITPLRSEDLLTAACARTLRSLTPAEWQHSLDDEPVRPTCQFEPPPASKPGNAVAP